MATQSIKKTFAASLSELSNVKEIQDGLKNTYGALSQFEALVQSDPVFAELARGLNGTVKIDFDPDSSLYGSTKRDWAGDITLNAGKANSQADVLNTIIHEMVHRRHGRIDTSDLTSFGGTRTLRKAIRGSESDASEVLRALADSGMMGGSEEPIAYIVSNMLRGPQALDPGSAKFMQQYAAFSNELMRLQARPDMAPQVHYAAYPELGVLEKILNTLFGYQPEVKPRNVLPPWVQRKIENK